MSISKTLSLPRPLNLPKPAPTAQASASKPPAQAQGGVAGQAASPHKGIAKPLGGRTGPSVDSFNPNAKPVNLPGAVGRGINPNAKPKPHDGPIIGINPNTPNGGVIVPGGGWANPQRTEKPHDLPPTVGINPNTPNGGVIIPGGGWANPQRTEKPSGPFFETGGWANHGLGKPEVTGLAIGGRNPNATGDINTHGTKPPQPQPWTTYGEALEQNRDVFPNKDTYDLGAAFDKAFGQGAVLGGAELQPGGGWGDLIEANRANQRPDTGFSGGAETKPGGGWGDLLEANGAVPPGYFDPK